MSAKSTRFRLGVEALEQRRLLAALVESTSFNDTVGTAERLMPSPSPIDPRLLQARVSGDVTSTDSSRRDRDLFAVPVRGGDEISFRIETPNSSLVPEVRLIDQAGQTLGITTSLSGNGAIGPYRVPGSGLVFVEVASIESISIPGLSATTGSYELRVDVGRGIPLESDSNSLNDLFAGASALTLQPSATRREGAIAGISELGDTDHFFLGSLTVGEIVELTSSIVPNSNLNHRVELVNAAGVVMADSIAAPLQSRSTIAADGIYFARVVGLSGLGPDATYQLRANVLDTVSPRVLDAIGLPAANSEGTSLIGGFTLLLNEAVDVETLTPSRFGLVRRVTVGPATTDVPVPMSVQPDASGQRLHFTFDEGPLADGSYRVFLTSGVTDVSGNPVFTSTGWNRDFRIASTGANRVPESRQGDSLANSPTLTLVADSGEARLLSTARPGIGIVQSPNDTDPFQFAGRAGDRVSVTVRTTAGSMNPSVAIWSAAGNVLTEVIGDHSDLTATVHTFVLPSDGNYFAVAGHGSGATPSSYEVRVRIARGAGMMLESDGASANNTILSANRIEWVGSSGAISGQLRPPSTNPPSIVADVDFFSIGVVDTGVRLTAELRSPSGIGSAALGDSGEVVWVNAAGTILADANAALGTAVTTTTTAGEIFARVARRTDAIGNVASGTEYRLNISVVDSNAPRVLETINLPASGTTPKLFGGFGYVFNEPMDAGSFANAIDVRTAGTDAAFGTADDVIHAVTSSLDSTGQRLLVQLTDGPISNSNIRVTLSGSGRDRFGNSIASTPVIRNVAFQPPGGVLIEGRGNGSMATATPVPLIEASNLSGIFHATNPVLGSLDAINDVDFYRFTARAGDSVAIRADWWQARSGNERLTMDLLDADGRTLQSVTGGGLAGGASIQFDAIPRNGDYFISVSSTQFNAPENYRVRIDLARQWMLESDIASSNDLQSSANPLQLQNGMGSIAGTILQDDVDFVSIGRLGAGSTVSVLLRQPNWSALEGLVELIDFNGIVVASSGASSSPLTANIVTAGEHFIRVTGRNLSGPDAQYLLGVTVSDSVAPRVASISRLPIDSTPTSDLISEVRIGFDEPMNRATLVGNAVGLREAGTDRSFGTTDDRTLPVIVTSISTTAMTVRFLDGPLGNGRYQLTVGAPAADVAGNRLATASATRTFEVNSVAPGQVIERGGNDEWTRSTVLNPLVSDPISGWQRTAVGVGSLDVPGDLDWWHTDAVAGDHVRGLLLDRSAGSSLPVTLYQFDASENAIVPIGSIVPVSGLVYAAVQRLSTDNGNYDFRFLVNRGPAIENESLGGNQTLLTANSVPFAISTTIAGTLSDASDVDVFDLGIHDAGSVVTTQFRSAGWSSLVGRVELLGKNGETLTNATSNSSAATVQATLNQATQVFARVRPESGADSNAQYRLDVSVVDSTSPRLLTSTTLPIQSAVGNEVVAGFRLLFTEQLQSGSVSADSIRLRSTGPDDVFGNGDDILIPLSNPVVAPENDGQSSVTVTPASGLVPSGRVRLEMDQRITDRSGNRLAGAIGSETVVRSEVFRIAASTLNLVGESNGNEDFRRAAHLTLSSDDAGTTWRTGPIGVGVLDSASDIDWWSFDASAGDFVDISLDSDAGRVTLFPPNDDSGFAAAIEGTALDVTGRYYVLVESTTTTPTPYQLHLGVSHRVPIESLTLERLIGAKRGSVAGKISSPKDGIADRDLYPLGRVQFGETILASIRLPQSSTLVPLVEILDSSGNIVSPATNDPLSARWTATQEDAYFVSIVGWGGAGPRARYNLDVAVSSALAAPDLTVGSVTAPATGEAGNSILLSWLVSNRGSLAALGGWSERVTLSVNDVLGDDDDLVLTTITQRDSLLQSASVTRNATVALPIQLSGAFHVFVSVDAENDVFEQGLENNNAARAASTINVSARALPDLIVPSGTITVTGNALPGQPLSVTWSVSNVGTASASGGWMQRVSLVDEDGSRESILLAEVRFSGSLSVGSVTRNEPLNVILPPDLPAGNWRLAIELDSRNQIIESRESNRFVALNAIAARPSLGWSFATRRLNESETVTAILHRSGDVSSTLSVNLTATGNAAAIAFPTVVTFAPGQSSVSVSITATDDDVPRSEVPVTLNATASGLESASTALTVLDDDRPQLSLSLNNPINLGTVEGTTVGVTVRRTGATTAAAVIRLTMRPTGQWTVPQTVTIPVGQASTTFNVALNNDNDIEDAAIAELTAAGEGLAPTLLALPMVASDAPIFTLTVPSVLPESGLASTDGAAGFFGELTLSATNPRPLSFALIASPTGHLQLPDRITVPANQRSVRFVIAGIDNSISDGPRQVQVTAIPIGIHGTPVDATLGQRASVNIVDDEREPLRFEVSSDVLVEGRTINGVVRRLSNDVSQPLTVQLRSSDTTEATLPDSVVIGAGQASVGFTISGVNDSITDGLQTVTLTARLEGLTVATTSIAVVDGAGTLPDLQIDRYSVVSSRLTSAPNTIVASIGQSVDVRWSTINNGIGPASTEWTERLVWESVDNDRTGESLRLLAAEFSFSGPLAVGTMGQREATVRVPDAPGRYRLNLLLDENNQLVEILETNNSLASVVVNVVSGLVATVATPTVSATAGTPVVLSGTATLIDGTPARNTDVAVTLTHRQTQRQLIARTNSEGQFTTTFESLASESGSYTVAAGHPMDRVGDPQDRFELTSAPEMAVIQPTRIADRLVERSTSVITSNANTGTVSLRIIDESFYQSMTRPPVTTARITLRNPLNNSVVATSEVSVGGVYRLPNVVTGIHAVEVTAANHETYRGLIEVANQVQHELELFLAQASALTVDSMLDLSDLRSVGDSIQQNVSLTNRGSVPALDVRWLMPTSSSVRFSPIVNALPIIAPGQTLVVPVRVERVALAMINERLDFAIRYVTRSGPTVIEHRLPIVSTSSPAAPLGGVSPIVRQSVGVGGPTIEMGVSETRWLASSGGNVRVAIASPGINDALNNVAIDLDVRSALGVSITENLLISVPQLTGLTSINGQSNLAAGTIGSAVWSIVPSRAAIDAHPGEWTVTATVRFTQSGETRQVTLNPIRVATVAEPVMNLKIFVDSNDPLQTKAIAVRNVGSGAARNLRIDGIGTPAIPLGEVSPDSTLLSVLDVSTTPPTLRHDTQRGEPRLTSINETTTHRLVRLLDVDSDSQTDLLVDDLPDAAGLPDTLYLSSGMIVPVTSNRVSLEFATTAMQFGSITLGLAAGWNHVVLDQATIQDGDTIFITRPDGSRIPTKNIWSTPAVASSNTSATTQFIDFVGENPSRISYQVRIERGGLGLNRIVAASGTPATATSDPVRFVDLVFSQAVDLQTLQSSDLQLRRSGTLVPLGNIEIVPISRTTIRVASLESLTNVDGVYELSVSTAAMIDPFTITWTRASVSPAVSAFIDPPANYIRQSVSQIDVRLTRPVDLATFRTALSVSREGVPINLASATITTLQRSGPNDPVTIRIAGLTTLTNVDGLYRLNINGSTLVGENGNKGVGQLDLSSSTIQWTRDSVAPVLQPASDSTIQLRSSSVDRIELNFSEPIALETLTASDLVLTQEGSTTNLIPTSAGLRIERGEGSRIIVSGLSAFQSVPQTAGSATFMLAVSGGSITDAAGNVGSGTMTQRFTIDSRPPAVPSILNLSIVDQPRRPGDSGALASLNGRVAEPNLTVSIIDPSTTIVLASQLITGTEFTLPFTLPATGLQQLRARLSDAAGNAISFSLPDAFTNNVPPRVLAIEGVPLNAARLGVDSLTIRFEQPVRANTVAPALLLTRDGGNNLIVGSVRVEPSPDNRTFIVSGLTDRTNAPGEYRLSIDLRAIASSDGQLGFGETTRRWTVDATAPTTNIRFAPTSNPSDPNRFVAVDFGSEAPSAIAATRLYAASATRALSVSTTLLDGQIGGELRNLGTGPVDVFAASIDQAGNVEPLRLTSSIVPTIIVDAVFATSADAQTPRRFIVGDANELRLTGNWNVLSPSIGSVGLVHRVVSDNKTFEIQNDRPFQNPVLATDVDRNGVPTALDALRIINQINRTGDALPPIGDADAHQYLDVTGDGLITALDALRVINAVNALSSGQNSEPLVAPEEALIATSIDQVFNDDEDSWTDEPPSRLF